MSKISELLNLIPLGFKNREGIIEGISNSVKMSFGSLSQDEQDEILRRRVICETCPLMSKNVLEHQEEYIKLTGGSLTTSRTDNFCSLCSCNIDLKTSSLTGNCGAKSFNEEGKGKQLAEVRWTEYIKTNKTEE